MKPRASLREICLFSQRTAPLWIEEGFTAAAENLALYNLYLNKFGTTPEAALSEEDIANGKVIEFREAMAQIHKEVFGE